VEREGGEWIINLFTVLAVIGQTGFSRPTMKKKMQTVSMKLTTMVVPVSTVTGKAMFPNLSARMMTMKPKLRAVNNAQSHARDLARQRVAEWRSNAQREGLPVTNVRDGKGAELLDVDQVVRGSYPTYEASEKRSIWTRLFRR
jgi:hypothetical protein